MAEQNLYEYINYIFSFYEKRHYGAGNGMFLRRSVRTNLIKRMASGDERYAYDIVIDILCLNKFLEASEDNEFIKLTKKGEQYIRGAKDVPINPFLQDVIQFSKGKEWLNHELWLMVGDQKLAPFYIDDLLLYDTLVLFVEDKKSYADYIQIRNKQHLSVHRSAWLEDLIELIPKGKWEELLMALSEVIENAYYSGGQANENAKQVEGKLSIPSKMKSHEVKIEIKDQVSVVFQTMNGGNNQVTANVKPSQVKVPRWVLIAGYIAVVVLLGIFVFLCYKEYQVSHDITSVITSKQWEKWISTILAVILLVLKQIFK